MARLLTTSTNLLILHNLLFVCAPGVTRTPGQRFRKPLLYPPELRGQGSRSGSSPALASAAGDFTG